LDLQKDRNQRTAHRGSRRQCLDLAKEASLQALETAGLTPNDLDLVIMTTMTPDTSCPSGANWLEAKLEPVGLFPSM